MAEDASVNFCYTGRTAYSADTIRCYYKSDNHEADRWAILLVTP